MRILITGGAGYIGSELIQFLLDEGHNVDVLDSLMYDRGSLLRYAGHPNFHFKKADVRDKITLNAHMKKADVIIPLAALVGFPLCDEFPRDATEVNFEINEWIAQNKRPEQKVIYPLGRKWSRGGQPNIHSNFFNLFSKYKPVILELIRGVYKFVNRFHLNPS